MRPTQESGNCRAKVLRPTQHMTLHTVNLGRVSPLAICQNLQPLLSSLLLVPTPREWLIKPVSRPQLHPPALLRAVEVNRGLVDPHRWQLSGCWILLELGLPFWPPLSRSAVRMSAVMPSTDCLATGLATPTDSAKVCWPKELGSWGSWGGCKGEGRSSAAQGRGALCKGVTLGVGVTGVLGATSARDSETGVGGISPVRAKLDRLGHSLKIGSNARCWCIGGCCCCCKNCCTNMLIMAGASKGSTTVGAARLKVMLGIRTERRLAWFLRAGMALASASSSSTFTWHSTACSVS